MLDLSHIHLSEHDIARFALKRDAAALAKARGWNRSDIMRAFNRFNIFWVVGDRYSADTEHVRLATRTPGTVDVPYRRPAA
jgi:hypothetical protein